MKPESAEMQEVILEDTESEARNDFVVFEIKGKLAISYSVRRNKIPFLCRISG